MAGEGVMVMAAMMTAEGGGGAGEEAVDVVVEGFHDGEAGGYDAEVYFEAVVVRAEEVSKWGGWL